MTSSASGSATATMTASTPNPPEPMLLVLRLPPAPVVQPPATVSWEENVIDNEHMKRKKSKKCCIFHKQRPFDESDSEHEDEDDVGGWELDSNGVPKWVGKGKDDHHEHNGNCCS